MKRFSPMILAVLISAVLSGIPVWSATDGAKLLQQISAAKPGTTVTLPAGAFTVADIDVPKGVSLRGAGYDKTILLSHGQYGIHLAGTAKVAVSDLTVQGAASAGVLVEDGAGVTLSRVRAVRCLTGITLTGGHNLRVENCVAGENTTGIVVNHAANSTVVNCTMVRNSTLGLSVNGTTGSAMFNNVLANNSIGIFLAQNNTRLVVDHNLYWGALIGKGKDAAFPTIASWRAMEQQDQHSAMLAVDFVDTTTFNYQPASTLAWASDRATTAGWGAAKLAGYAAPVKDIAGQPRRQGVCAGAWEATFTPTRPADGSFTISSADGVKTAGLFDANNREINWLFTMLPLAKGTYQYWLPTRDWQGRPIPAGKYSLRISEANLGLKFIAAAGNTAGKAAHDIYSSTSIDQVIYDSKNQPILALHWSESYRQYRAMDGNLQHERWMIPGCAADYGAASDGHGHLYALREVDQTQVTLCRIDEESGKIEEVAPGEYGMLMNRSDLGTINGIAVLSDRVFLASTDRNKLLLGPKFATGLDVPAPLFPCADRGRNLIWLVSNREKVLALTPEGAIKYQFDPKIAGLYSLAVNGNRLALLSPVTGTVYLYDITDPANPQAVRTIGTGDGPYGPIQPDRFQFQTSDNIIAHAKVALDNQGTVAVTDKYGVKLFAWDGTPKRDFSGIWGQYIDQGARQPGQPLELVDLMSMRTMLLDEKSGATRWGAMYGPPVVKNFAWDSAVWYFFQRDGKRYGFFTGGRMVPRADGKQDRVQTFLIARYDGYVGTPLLAFCGGPAGVLRFDDFSKDFNDPAGWQPQLTSQGKPVSLAFWDPPVRIDNGDLLLAGVTVTRVPLHGFDSKGLPIYDFDHAQQLALRGDQKLNTVISPYDYKTEEAFPGAVKHAEFFTDGALASTIYLSKTGHGSGMCNWSGTEVAGYDKSGVVRWLTPMPQIKDPEGTRILDDVSYSIACPYSELQMLDKDGMYLGSSGVPRELYWEGMWLDNSRQFAALKGNTGKHYIVFGNFNDCVAWWTEVTGRETITHHTLPVTIADAKAAVLAAQPEPPLWKKAANTTTQVKIAKLAAPLPIDGELAKWRTAVPTPQIMVTPETGTGISGPADASALFRLAYEGNNLYVQCLRFDNLVTMFQTRELFYKQDCLEMAINSFPSGIKLNVTKIRGMGDTIVRDGWFIKPKELDPATSPRVIKVLDNAKDVPERKILEQIYGVDLSNSKVIVTEFKVPLNDDTFTDRLDAKPTMTSGSTMYLGIGIDDNDSPGADLQKMLVWPPTYGTFADRYASALVIFE